MILNDWHKMNKTEMPIKTWTKLLFGDCEVEPEVVLTVFGCCDSTLTSVSTVSKFSFSVFLTCLTEPFDLGADDEVGLDE